MTCQPGRSISQIAAVLLVAAALGHGPAQATPANLLSRDLAGHSAVMLLIEPESGAILDANPAAELFYGYPLKRLTSLRIQDINALNPSDVQAERRLAATQNRSYFVFPHLLANGRLRTVEVYSSPLTLDSGVQALLSIVHDVTTRPRADLHAAEYQSRLETLVSERTQEVVSSQSQLRWMLSGGLLLTLTLNALLLLNARSRRKVLAELRSEIASRQAAQEALERSQGEARERAQWLATLIQSIQDQIYVVDAQGLLTECHLSSASEHTPEPQRLLGRHYRDLLPATVATQFHAAFEGVQALGHPRELSYTLPQGNTELSLLATVSRLEGGDAAQGSFLVVVRDVTTQASAERSLRVAATAFETQEGMLITDARTVIRSVNQAFARITGFSKADVVGKTPQLLRSGRHDAAFYRAFWQSVEQIGSWQGEIWNRHQDGHVFPLWLVVTAVRGPQGDVTNYVGTLTDITERKAAEEEIRQLAFYDALTHLPNRRLLRDRIDHAVLHSTRTGLLGALVFIDLDNFKLLNDTLGHNLGDRLLTQVAQRLLDSVREGDTVSRLGGDEFVVMLEDLALTEVEAITRAEAIAAKLTLRLSQAYELGGTFRHLTQSMGVALFGQQRVSVEDLLKRADMAMYQAKADGRNTLRFFNPGMQANMEARTTLESDLRRGLAEHEFLLHYQVQVNEHATALGAEALLRWNHPQRGRVSPAEFIPLAEETGLILPLGQWVLNAACEQLARWARQPATAGLMVSVNVSARQFRHQGFEDSVTEALTRTGAAPQRLKLELTESLLLDDVETTIQRMNALQRLGIRFSLDDFGTGYSSLAYLKRLPIEQLKIDQGFVRDIVTNPNDAAIARAVVALGTSLGMEVIAEGVETQAQRDCLLELGCRAFQGYLFGRPQPADEWPGSNPMATPDAPT